MKQAVWVKVRSAARAVWARVRVAGRGMMVDRAPSCVRTHPNRALCPQKPSTLPRTPGVLLGQGKQGALESVLGEIW